MFYFIKLNSITRKHKYSEWITTAIVKSINFRDKLYKKLKYTDIYFAEFESRKNNVRTYNVMLNTNIYLVKKNYCPDLFDKYKLDKKKPGQLLTIYYIEMGRKSILYIFLKINESIRNGINSS